MAELRKSKGNYILRKKRQTTSKGSIYERDWMTVTELDGFAKGTLPVYASGNFKMTINTGRTTKKKYGFSNWLVTDEGENTWTDADINEETIRFDSNLIKPNYSSILDFACYGSAVELIRGTMNDVYARFPGEIYFNTEDEVYLTYYDYKQEKMITEEDPSVISENPFFIDLWTSAVDNDRVDNPLRYMCLSWEKYCAYVNESPYKITEWKPAKFINKTPINCLTNGDILFSGATLSLAEDEEGQDIHRITYSFIGEVIDGKIYIVLKDCEGGNEVHIRLKKEYLDEEFDKLDDFEKALLNRETKPLYKAKFWTPTETETGVITNERVYTWPTLESKWNPDMETNAYESYLNSLLYLAQYYDEIRTDNIWRSYTHESIKNFDWTTPKDTYEPEIDGDLIETERIEKILRVCGRQFDDLKRYIENIRHTVNISYDSKNNMPEKDMAKFLEMSGWEVKNVSPISDNSQEYEIEYPGKTLKLRPEDANKEFLRRMILNSRNILSKKGTRAGIQAVYAMFGIEETGVTGSGYSIDEFNVYINNFIESGSTENTHYSDTFRFNERKDDYDDVFVETEDPLCGLMANEYIDNEGKGYIVPWYDEYAKYDGGQYYQSKGGWGKREYKEVDVEFAPEITEISGDSLYDETVKNIKVASDFTELNNTPIGFLSEGDIYYVIDMEMLNSVGSQTPISACSHYVFFSKEESIPDGLSYIPYNNEYVWCIVENDEFTGTTVQEGHWWANDILYRESTHDVSAGNNPHNGNGKYDGGNEYLEHYKELFKGAIDNDMFSRYNNLIDTENAKRRYENKFSTIKLDELDNDTVSASTIGFEFNEGEYCGATIDNNKVWHFNSMDDGIYDEGVYIGRIKSDEYNVLQPLSGGTFSDGEETVMSAITCDNFPVTAKTEDYPNAPILDSAATVTGKKYELSVSPSCTGNCGNGTDEIANYSVINTKLMRITYHGLDQELENYITNVVEFYVKQMIPSTAIVEFVWTGEHKPPTRNMTSLSLSPSRQMIRSDETEATIDISSVGVESIGIASER